MAEPTTSQVVLMSAGWSLVTSEYGEVTGTRVYFDASAVPNKATVNLPAVGDAWDTGVNAGVKIRNVVKSPIGEDTSSGFMYVCSYSSDYGAGDMLSSDRTDKQISVHVSTGGEFDSYTVTSGEGTDVYTSQNLTDWTKLKDSISIHKMTPQTNVTVTERYTGTIGDLIAENAAYAGKLNTSTMWGLARGMVLCTGVTAVPIKVVVDKAKVINWNRQYNYVIRHITVPGATVENAWQAVFVKGKYVILSNSDSSSGVNAMAPYEYAELPDPLPKSTPTA